MKKAEILKKYKQEVRSGDFQKIHEQYGKEHQKLFKKYEIKNRLLAPLIILSVGLAAGEIACIATDNPAGFYALIIPLILSFIAIKINNSVIDSKQRKMQQRGSKYRNADMLLQDKYYNDYHSVIGYYKDLYAIDSTCSDYDSNHDIHICGVTGQPISDTEYLLKCKKPHAFKRCECTTAYYKSLHD